MIRNYNPLVVTLDREAYDRLERLAAIGAAECGEAASMAALTRHARRFNPALKQEAERGRAAAAAHQRELQQAVAALVRDHFDRTVWVRARPTAMLHPETTHWVPVRIRGREPGKKLHLRVSCEIHCGRLQPGSNLVTYDEIITELPQGLVERGLHEAYPGTWTEPAPAPPAPFHGTEEDYRRQRQLAAPRVQMVSITSPSPVDFRSLKP